MSIGYTPDKLPVVYDDSESQLYAVGNGLKPINVGGGSSSYLVYTIGLQQSGLSTDAPTLTTYQNTFGGAASFTREDVGVYFTDTTTDFPADNSSFYVIGQYAVGGLVSIPYYSAANSLQGFLRVEITSNAGKVQFYLYCYDSSGVAGDLANVFGNGIIRYPEIRMY